MFHYHPTFSQESTFINNLITKQEQFNSAFFKLWNKLTTIYLEVWARNNDLRVLSGPIYNNENKKTIDEHIDEESNPSHFFFVVYKNSDDGSNINHDDVLPFILPNYSTNFTCNYDSNKTENENFIEILKIHFARLRDIEFLTGFSFENILYEDKSSIESIQHRLFLPELNGGLWNEEELLMAEFNEEGDPDDEITTTTAGVTTTTAGVTTTTAGVTTTTAEVTTTTAGVTIISSNILLLVSVYLNLF